MGSAERGYLNERQHRIVELLQLDGEVKITELSEVFQVTEMTIRRDLEKLEAQGTVKRTFGGAIYVNQDVNLQERVGYMVEEKRRIGRSAASLVREGDSLFLDGGTTTLQVARYLPAHMHLTVVTNAMNVAAELASKGIVTVVTGGLLRESTSSLVGPAAVQSISGMAFDKVFLGTTGMNATHGFSNSNLFETEIKRMAIRQSEQVIIVSDHTKCGAKMLLSFATLRDVDCIVTDRPLPEPLAQACLEAGTEIVVAPYT